MAFRIFYHEDALADLEEIFTWPREQHAEKTQRFADDLFNHLDFLQTFPYVGAPVKGHPVVRRLLHSPLFVYYRVDESRGGIEILRSQSCARLADSRMRCSMSSCAGVSGMALKVTFQFEHNFLILSPARMVALLLFQRAETYRAHASGVSWDSAGRWRRFR
jgi:plasmid stabilization system protein ParE